MTGSKVREKAPDERDENDRKPGRGQLKEKFGVAGADTGVYSGTSIVPAMEAVGALVRKTRGASSMSLATLAAAADLSPGLLSQIERGLGNPSFTTLIKLAYALKVPVGNFFVSEQSGGALTRKGKHPRLLLAEENLVYELLTPDLNGRFAMIKAQIAPGWTNEHEPFQHEGEECIVITEGDLFIKVGDSSYDLSEGDSLTYDASVPHWYHNRSGRNAILIGTTSPPSF